MKERHSYKDLFSATGDKLTNYMSEYLQLANTKPEIVKKLPFHERIFVFMSLHQEILNKNPSSENELFTIIEAQEYFFQFVNNIYLWDIDFVETHHHPITQQLITKEQQEFYRDWHNEILIGWIEKINQGKDIFCKELQIAINRKKQGFLDSVSKGKPVRMGINQFEKMVYSRSFAIYYVCRCIFPNSTNFKTFKIDNNSYIITVKTIIHILFRHYIPSMDIITETRTQNHEIKDFDILFLDAAIKSLIAEYVNSICPAPIKNDSYWLFIIDNVKHILWLKKSKIGQAFYDKNAYEIATFYRCEEYRDLKKFKFTSIKIKIAPNRYGVISFTHWIKLLFTRLKYWIYK